MPRLLLSTFYFLLSTLSLLLLPASLHAESSLIIKPDDNQVRATERLSDFLESIGYTVEYRDEDKDSLIIHQQQHRIHATLTVGENELTILTLAIHYKFKPKSGTREERALVANTINNRQYGIKVCFDEESNDLYFEYALPFDSYLVPRTMKRFADQAVATTYIMINSDKAINDAFFREKDSPDSARNADEVDAEEDGEKMNEEGESAAPQSSVSPVPPPSSSLVPISPPSSPSSSPTSPVPPSRGAAVTPPSSLAPISPSSSPSSSAPAAPVPPPSPSLVPVSPPSSPSSSAPAAPVPPSPSSTLAPISPSSSPSSSTSAPVTPPSSPSSSPTSPVPPSRGAAVPPSPMPPSLQPALPPTTPASPAPSKKTRA